MTHSPGPWELAKVGNNYDQYMIFDRDHQIVNSVEGLPNARLIKSAPMLLDALRYIADRGPVEGYGSAEALRLRLMLTQTIARTAIAEATEE